MPTTCWCTARPAPRSRWCWPGSSSGYATWAWPFTRTRPGSCTAGTASGAAGFRSCRSPSWDSCSPPRPSRNHRGEQFLAFSPPRPSRNHRGEQFLAFLPAISPQALTKIGRVVRRWRLHRRIFSTFEELARAINPIVAGWMAYYGRFYRSKLSALLARINAYLVRWIRNKYRRLDRTRAAHAKLAELAAGQPRLFRHWAWVTTAWR